MVVCWLAEDKSPAVVTNLRRPHRDSEGFVRFVNLLLNDTTYLLDEALIKLAEIHSYQLRMKDQETWHAMPQNERVEAERNLATAERMATTYMHLANETVNMVRNACAYSDPSAHTVKS